MSQTENPLVYIDYVYWGIPVSTTMFCVYILIYYNVMCIHRLQGDQPRKPKYLGYCGGWDLKMKPGRKESGEMFVGHLFLYTDVQITEVGGAHGGIPCSK